MSNDDDTTIGTLAHTIAGVIRDELPEAVLHDRVDGILKAAEAKAATFLHEHTGEAGPAKFRHDELSTAAWALRRLLDEFPARPLHDAGFTIDPATMEDLCRASAAVSAANTLIAKAARREGARGGDAA